MAESRFTGRKREQVGEDVSQSANHFGTGDSPTSSLEITFIQHEEGRYRPNGSEMTQETSPLTQAASP